MCVPLDVHLSDRKNVVSGSWTTFSCSCWLFFGVLQHCRRCAEEQHTCCLSDLGNVLQVLPDFSSSVQPGRVQNQVLLHIVILFLHVERHHAALGLVPERRCQSPDSASGTVCRTTRKTPRRA